MNRVPGLKNKVFRSPHIWGTVGMSWSSGKGNSGVIKIHICLYESRLDECNNEQGSDGGVRRTLSLWY